MSTGLLDTGTEAPSYVLLPIRVDALWLAHDRPVVGATADFSRLPFSDQVRDYNPDVANISDDIANHPYDGEGLYLKKGVHLHWRLPWGLTTDRKGNDGRQFPAVPDRWLVVRWRGPEDNRTVEDSEAWVIESNYLYLDGEGVNSGSIAFPVPSSLRKKIKGQSTPTVLTTVRGALDQALTDLTKTKLLAGLKPNNAGEKDVSFGLRAAGTSILGRRGSRWSSSEVGIDSVLGNNNSYNPTSATIHNWGGHFLGG